MQYENLKLGHLTLNMKNIAIFNSILFVKVYNEICIVLK